jgi:LAO/AO transport system ATPase
MADDGKNVDGKKVRILLAKIGLDGHDRGVKVLAQSFRDAGFDVIYTGLWQTSESTMFAAMQEDVDVVGVSLLSAAHMTIMPEMLRHRETLGISDIPLVLGGIVPDADLKPLKEMGVAAVFKPGSAMDEIVRVLKDLGDRRAKPSVSDLLAGYEKRRGTALAQMITRIQEGESFDGWEAPKGSAKIIGVTGAPGVGKSSFIGKLSSDLRTRGRRVAVVAVDPTSPVTGGALLGDRLRMMSAKPDEGFFVRSLSSGDRQGGLGPHCEDVVSLLDGYGFEVILVETVGAGQGDVAVRNIADETVLLLMPDSGDAIQFAKAGIMEIASVFVLNKCDLEGADRTEAQLRSTINHDRKLFKVSTVRNEGIDAVSDWVESLLN